MKKPPRMRGSNKMNMCEGSIMPQLIKFAFPLMVTGVLQVLFNAADIIVVGKFAENSERSLAAVGATGSLISLIVNLFIGLSVGTNVLCARYFGAKEHDNLSKTVHTSMIVSVVIGIILTVIGFFGAKTFLGLMSVPPEVLPLSTLYIRIYFLGMVPMLVYNFAAAILRSVGDTKRPMYFLLLAGVANVLLNMLLVIVFHLDVAGVAIATVASQVISATLTVICLIRDDGSIKLRLSLLKCDRQKLLLVIKIGLPAGLQSTMFAIANVIIQSSLNAYDIAMTGGTGVIVAGCSAASSIESFIFTAMDAVYQAVVSFTSQNFGVRNYKRIKKAQMYGQILVSIVGVTLCTLCIIFAEQLVGLYADKNSVETITIGANRLRLVGGSCFIYGCSNIMVATIRGLGYSLTPMITSLICVCGARLIWIATAFRVWYDIYVLYAAFPISYVLSLAAQFVCKMFVLKNVVKRFPAPAEQASV